MRIVLGNSRVLADAAPGDTYKLPDFSPDDQWLLYTRARRHDLARRSPERRPLHPEALRLLRPARAGSGVAEPITWIVMERETPVGARSQDHVGQLWAAAFFPERGVVSRPIYLSGQRPDVVLLHAPLAMP